MASASSWSTALRHTTTRRRPLSLQLLPSSSSSSSVRWASIVPYVVAQNSCYSPPPPPMTLEQLDQLQQRKQQSLLEEQIQLEQSQRMRQQRELQLELAKHRNAILEQQHQQQLLRRREHEKQLQELQQQQQQQQQQQENNHQRSAAEQQQVPCNDSAADDSGRHPAKTPLHPYVPTHRRSMFGYRGPEQRMALSTTSEAVASLTEDGVEESRQSAGVTSVQTPFMMAAESRVRLAMMDYTPKQIDAMTPEEAQAILSCPASSSTSFESNTLQEEQCDVSKSVEELTEAIAGVRVLSSTSTSTSAAVADISLDMDQEDHRYTLQASLPVHGQGHDAEGHVSESSRRAPRNPSSSSSSSTL